jgi:hypothetical protein
MAPVTGDHTPDDRVLAALAGVGQWSQQQADDFELARATLSALVAAYAERIAAADGDQVDQLRAEQARYAHERRMLTVGDDDAVARILRDYPPLVRALDADAGRP